MVALQVRLGLRRLKRHPWALQVYEGQHVVHRMPLSHLDNDAVKALVDGVCQRWRQFAEPGKLHNAISTQCFQQETMYCPKPHG